MALCNAIRGLAALSKPSAIGRQVLGYATATRRDVVNQLDNTEDPDVAAAIKEYQRATFKAGKVDVPKAEEGAELTAQVERKYVAAEVVESGIQNLAVPLGGSGASVRRYVNQLLSLGSKAGFESPCTEVSKRVAEQAKTAETVKDLLNRIKPYTSADYHAALSEALAQVEAETNSSVTLDGSSAGYKKFAEKVKAVAKASGLPVQTLLDAKKGDDEAKAYAVWAQSAQVADANAELNVLRAEATAVLDKHLGKTADQIRKEQQAAVAALVKKVESAKGAAWAQQFQKDLQSLSWFDSQVAASPASGPKATA